MPNFSGKGSVSLLTPATAAWKPPRTTGKPEWPCSGHTEHSDQGCSRPPLPLSRKACLSHNLGAQGFCHTRLYRLRHLLRAGPKWQGDSQPVPAASMVPRGMTVLPQPHKGALAPRRLLHEAHRGLGFTGLPEPCSPGRGTRLVTQRHPPPPCERGMRRLGARCAE